MITFPQNPLQPTENTSRVYNSFSGTDILCMAHVQGKAGEPGIWKIFAELQTLTVSSVRNVFPVRRLGESHAFAYTKGARTIAGTMVFSLLRQDVMVDFYRRPEIEANIAAPFFVDQIRPMSIFVYAANEHGASASAALINVHLTNFGQTLSVDDLYTETTYSYVAEHYFPFVQNPMELLASLETDASMIRPLSEIGNERRNLDQILVDKVMKNIAGKQRVLHNLLEE